MNEPDRFQSGEILSASRLNDALDYSRGQYAQIPGHDFAVFGGQNANATAKNRFDRVMLVQAREDFEIRITNCATEDDIPAGRVNLPRVIPQVNAYDVPESIRPDWVYDPVAGLSGSASKREGDYFHAVYNEDSGRWEVLTANAPPVVTAIVLSCLDDGWHEVMLTDWNGSPDDEQSVSASASASGSVSASASDDPCDICQYLSEEDLEGDPSACTSVETVTVPRTTGTAYGEIVYAHTTRLMPMMTGGMIKMIKRTSSSSSVSTSGSISVSDDMITDRLYDVVDGVWPLLALPFPDFECCVDPVTGARNVRIISCTKVVVEGYSCDGGTNPCPEGSESV